MQFSFTFLLVILLSGSSFGSAYDAEVKSNLQQNKFSKGTVALPSGETIFFNILYSHQEQQKGVSGIKANQFKKNQGVFFYYSTDSHRQFWMPNTYFDLDIIFLDKKLKIIHIAKNMKAHPGTKTTPPISKTPVILARHVLEIKANTKISKKLKIGMQLIWTSSYLFSEIEPNVHLLR